MKIGIANDHHGVLLKNRIIEYLEEKNIKYINYGCDEKDNFDYTEYAIKLCNSLKENEFDLGILICGTGIGMSIIANKFKGIYCAKVSNEKEAKLCREHNKANVIALGEDTQNIEEIVNNFITAVPSIEERHNRRIERIKQIEGVNL